MTRSVWFATLMESGCEVTAEDVREGRRPLLEILVHRVGRRPRSLVAAQARSGGPDHLELLGMLDGKAPEDDLIEQREDRRVGADAERQREHRHQGERRTTREEPEA